MRKGLSPLSVYISMAAAAWPEHVPSEFSAASDVPENLPEELQKMLLGIQRYYQHDFEVERLPLDTVWQQGSVSVNAVPGHEYNRAHEAIILIPSMINKSYILDLMEGRSMLRWMAARGLDPYLLDWGEVEGDEAQKNLSGTVKDRLVPALTFLHAHHGSKVHALGYCMGGTILLGAATLAQHHLKSITMLAAPWDFHAGSQMLLNRVKFWAPSAFPMIEEKGVLSVDWIQTLFASLDPVATAKKFAAFYDMDDDAPEAQIFIAVEDWLNDGVCLPAASAQHCIKDWFLHNHTYAGTWEIGSHLVRPSDIKIPVLIVASKRDRLVEYESGAALAEQIKHAKIINPNCGHIGMIAGGKAVQKVWGPIADWVQQIDA